MALSRKKIIKIRKGDKLLSMEQQMLFLQQLHRLRTQGYDMSRSLDFLNWQPQWQAAVQKLQEGLQRGLRLDEAFAHASFSSFIVIHLYVAHHDGNLEDALERSFTTMKKQMQQLAKFKKVTRYPIFLLSTILLLLLFVKLYVYPSFESLFAYSADSANQLHFFSSLVNMLFYGSLALAAISVCSFLSKDHLQKRLSSEKKRYYLEHLPIVSRIARTRTSFQFAIQMGNLLTAGLSLYESLQLLSKQHYHDMLQLYASDLLSAMTAGRTIDECLPDFPLLTLQLQSILVKHEDAASQSKDLLMYAEITTSKMEDRTKTLLHLLQPLLLCIMALCIIIVYLSLLLPMFQMVHTL
ncbi:type II secretion system F family protein [Terribacillus saccharophilus]|uniref:type II secretion system F family protein n=1 Tax=Terribacillus saccharophilus TaxID=361277 RepID=UPI003981C49B